MLLFKRCLFSFLILATCIIQCDENFYLSEDDVEELAKDYDLSSQSIEQIKLLQKIKTIEDQKILEYYRNENYDFKAGLIAGFYFGIVAHHITAYLLSYKIENQDKINDISSLALIALTLILCEKFSVQINSDQLDNKQ